MDELLADGKIRYVGLSNFHNALVKEANEKLQNGEIVVNELEYSLIRRDIEKEMIPFAKENNIALMTYYALMGGFLTTNYEKNHVFPKNDFRNHWELFRHKENFDKTQNLFVALREIAKEHDVTPAEVAINWVMKDDYIIPIIGAKKISHLKSNIHATQFQLTKENISRLNSVTDNLVLNWDWFDRIRPDEE